jgi:3-dehydroquinate dehydratase
MLANTIMKGFTNKEKKGVPCFELRLDFIDTEELDTIIEAIDKANQYGDAINWLITINHEYL